MAAGDNVTDLAQRRGTPITDELHRLTRMIADACPEGAAIQFTFHGALRVLIDVKTMEDVVVVELALKQIGAGLFREIARGQAPGHSFGRRITALVER